MFSWRQNGLDTSSVFSRKKLTNSWFGEYIGFFLFIIVVNFQMRYLLFIKEKTFINGSAILINVRQTEKPQM